MRERKRRALGQRLPCPTPCDESLLDRGDELEADEDSVLDEDGCIPEGSSSNRALEWCRYNIDMPKTRRIVKNGNFNPRYLACRLPFFPPPPSTLDWSEQRLLMKTRRQTQLESYKYEEFNAFSLETESCLTPG